MRLSRKEDPGPTHTRKTARSATQRDNTETFTDRSLNQSRSPPAPARTQGRTRPDHHRRTDRGAPGER